MYCIDWPPTDVPTSEHLSSSGTQSRNLETTNPKITSDIIAIGINLQIVSRPCCADWLPTDVPKSKHLSSSSGSKILKSGNNNSKRHMLH